MVDANKLAPSECLVDTAARNSVISMKQMCMTWQVMKKKNAIKFVPGLKSAGINAQETVTSAKSRTNHAQKKLNR